MMPTIATHDEMLVDLSAYRTHAPERGDIIVFTPPIPSQAPFIKRIVAVPGDAFAVTSAGVLVNGVRDRTMPAGEQPDYALALRDARILVDGMPLDRALANVPARTAWRATDRVPQGCYMVLGDNVNNSEDSHVFGCASIGVPFASGPRVRERPAVVGKVVDIFRERR